MRVCLCVSMHLLTGAQLQPKHLKLKGFINSPVVVTLRTGQLIAVIIFGIARRIQIKQKRQWPRDQKPQLILETSTPSKEQTSDLGSESCPAPIYILRRESDQRTVSSL